MRDQAPGVFSAQYQQSPIVSGGEVFRSDWWRFYDPADPANRQFRRIYICADTALKTGEQNDFTVLAAFGENERGIFLLDMVRGKFEAPELEAVFLAFWNKWREAPKAGYNRACSSVYVEDKASGTGLLQSVRRKGVPVIALRPTKDKYTRALEAIPTIAAGQFLLPESAGNSISAQVIAECEAFREDLTHPHDDIVDVMCYGISQHNKKRGFI